MTTRNRLVPAEWDADLIEALSEIAPDDVEGAKVWWERFAPIIYASLLDTLAVGDSRGLRDEIDIQQAVQEAVARADLTVAQQDWKKAGLLFVFLGGSYYTLKGVLLPDTRVRGSVTSALASSRPSTQAICDKLRTGNLSLRDWQMQMKSNIISTQVASGIVGAGGAENFTPDIMRTVERHISFQLEHLAALAGRIAEGMTLDGTVCRLMRMYMNSARGAYHAVDGIVKSNLGFTLYANVLGAGEEHCTGGGSCPEVSDRGFQPVGSLTPIGARNCMSNCLCHWEYMNPVTGETR